MAALRCILQLFIAVLCCCFLPDVQGQIDVSSFPALLFDGGSHAIVEGSVVWLYCEVNSTSPSLMVTWNRNSVPLVQDVPHVRIRATTSTTTTTSILIVDNFQDSLSDGGIYQCSTEDGGTTGNGAALTLTVSTSSSGSLQIVTNDELITGQFASNRTGYANEAPVSLDFEIGHVDDDSGNFTSPSVMWLKDGVPFRTTPTDTPGSDGRLSTSLSFTFQESGDAGVYQCVFNDTSTSEIYITIPIRLDTGDTLIIEAVFPFITILRVPEKLVLEVRATGRYDFIDWFRNGVIQGAVGGNFLPTSQQLPHFNEIYVQSNTTMTDLGVYETGLSASSGLTAPVRVDLVVIAPVDASTAISDGFNSTATVVEGEDVDISCTSTGVPVPTITWTLNNQATPFNQTGISTDFSVRVELIPVITDGNLTSTLHIVNAQYPSHDGMYECVGDGDTGNTSSLSITVQVTVSPEVTVTSSPVRVRVGGNVTLTCTVTRSNPMGFTYTWTNVNTTTVLPGETTATLSLTSITMEEIATYSCEVTNSGGGRGTGTITIQQGLAPIVSTRVSPPGPVVVGSTVDLVCEAGVGDEPITFSWTDSNGVAVSPSDTDGNISIIFTSTMEYTCIASNSFGMDTSTLSVEEAAILFQLRFPFISECTDWINDNVVNKAVDLVSEIVSELRLRCQCEITSDKITNGAFLCFPDSPQHVTYRAELHGTLMASTSQLLGNLEEWVTSGNSISVQAQVLTPDMTCVVAISTIEEDECRRTEMNTTEPSTLPITWIVIGVVLAFVVLAVLVIVVLVLVVIFIQRRSKMYIITEGSTKPQHVQYTTRDVHLSDVSKVTKDESETDEQSDHVTSNTD